MEDTSCFSSVSLCSKPESSRCVFIDQHTGNCAVQHAKGDACNTEHQNGQPKIHQGVTSHIRQDHDDAVGTTFHLRPRRVGLEQIVNGEIVDREKDTHSCHGTHQDYIVQWIFRATGHIQNRREPGADDQSRHGIDFDDFPRPDLKQPQHKLGLLVERVCQQTVVTVHKQRIGEASATVDQVHNKGKVRKPSHNHLVDVCLQLWFEGHEKQNSTTEDGTDPSDPER